jgi:hypothetical protein
LPEGFELGGQPWTVLPAKGDKPSTFNAPKTPENESLVLLPQIETTRPFMIIAKTRPLGNSFGLYMQWLRGNKSLSQQASACKIWAKRISLDSVENVHQFFFDRHYIFSMVNNKPVRLIVYERFSFAQNLALSGCAVSILSLEYRELDRNELPKEFNEPLDLVKLFDDVPRFCFDASGEEIKSFGREE